MNKLSIYEHSLKDIKSAFYDIISYEETQNNPEKLKEIKQQMNNLLNTLTKELENDSQEEIVKNNVEEVSNDIIPINFDVPEEKEVEQPTKEINIEVKEEPKVEENKPKSMVKIDSKKAKAILVLEKQITKLRASKEEKKQELTKVISEKEEFMKSVLVNNTPDDTEQKVKELEDQVKKYYTENNFEMAEKLLNQIKELSN